jgi:hypothetical protein
VQKLHKARRKGWQQPSLAGTSLAPIERQKNGHTIFAPLLTISTTSTTSTKTFSDGNLTVRDRNCSAPATLAFSPFYTFFSTPHQLQSKPLLSVSVINI